MKQKIFTLIFTLVLILQNIGAFANPFAYVTSKGGPGVEVIDTTTNTALTTVLIGGCLYITITPDGKFAYVTAGLGTIYVIDTATNTSIASFPIGANASGIAASPNGTVVYAAEGTANTIEVIDVATNTVTTSIPVGTSPDGIAFTPDGSFAYVVNSGSNNVSVINTATSSVTTTVGVGTTPQRTAVTPNGSFAYVTNSGSANVSVINTSTNTVTATVPVGANPNFIAITPDGNFAYVTNTGANIVSVINTATNTVTATIPVGNEATGIAITPDGATAYVVNKSDNTLSVIDVATNTVTATIPTGVGDPVAVAITPSITSQGSLSVTAKSKSDTFMLESDIYIQLNWSTPIEAAIPLHYRIYRDGVLIATIAAGEDRTYRDHNRKKNKTYSYLIVAEDELGPLASATTTLKAK